MRSHHHREARQKVQMTQQAQRQLQQRCEMGCCNRPAMPQYPLCPECLAELDTLMWDVLDASAAARRLVARYIAAQPLYCQALYN